MRRVLLCGAGLLAVTTAACSPSDLIHRIATPERDARAQGVIRMFVAGERDSLLARARFDGDSATIARALSQIDSVLRGRRVDSVTLIGANQFSSAGSDRVTLSYEFRTEKGWLGAAVTTVDSAPSWALLGFHVEPIAGDLRTMNDFRLVHRSPVHYFALLAMAACAIFTLGTAIFLATRRDFPKRWRWVLASLVGVGMVSVNWTTGAVGMQMLSLQLFGASVVRPSEFAPWAVSFSFPIGAIVALSRYRSYLGSLKATATPELLEHSASQQTAT